MWNEGGIMKKAPTKEQISKAVAAYLEKHNGEGIKCEQDAEGITRLTAANGMILDIFPDLACTIDGSPSPLVEKELRGYILEMAEDSSSGSNLAISRSTGMRISSDSKVPQSALHAVRECQATQETTYSTGKGKKAATAKTNIAALIEMGGSLDIVKRTHLPDYIEVVGRATLGDQHVDGSRSFYKQEYLAKKAWEWIVKILLEDPGIVSGTDDYGMPKFRDGAKIKVRIKDEGVNLLVELPAQIALWREMAREWQAAGRVCETVAYSRAADMLLRGDFQSKEELQEEKSEVEAIRDGAKAEVAT
jgi:hypothetical protein